MKNTSVLVDTNLLLDDNLIIFKLLKYYSEIVIPITVLKELDCHKTNPDLSYSARQAINSIREFKTKYPNNLNLVVNEDDISSNDQRIIRAAKDTGSIVATKDISMSIIAESTGIEAELYGNVANGIYEPYIYFDSGEVPSEFCYKQDYTGEEYFNIFDKVFNTSKHTVDSWFFVFIDNEDTTIVYANNPLNKTFCRIDNLPKYRNINDKDIELEARDMYQVCAIFALKNADNVLLTGKWGSGKSLLSSAYTLTSCVGKSFISRPPIGVDKSMNIGFLPGSAKDKLEAYAMGFLSSLYYFYGNTKNQDSDGKSYDFVKEEIFPQKYELIDSNSLQGLSLLDDTLMIDEVQYLSIDLMSMILSRATNDSKIILTGDIAQGYGMPPSNSGLIKLLRSLPHHSMAYVDLKNSYRSDLLELAEKLQDKSF